MNQKLHLLVEDEASLVDEQLKQLGYKVLKISDSQTVLNGLNLFENELFNCPDVLFIDNFIDTSYLMLLNNKVEHFCLGFDIDCQVTSKSSISVNKAKGNNFSMFSDRYIVIFKDHKKGNQFADYLLAD